MGMLSAPRVRIDSRLHPVVELGDAQELQAQPRAAAVASQQRHARGQAAAGALAADRDPVGVHAELRGVLGHPHQGGVAVLERGRERVLRRQAVVDGDHDRTDLGGDPAAVRVVQVEAADDEAAAVEVDQRRAAARRGRPAGSGAPARRAPPPARGRAARRLERDRRLVRRQRGQQVGLPGAGRRDVGEGQLGEDRAPRGRARGRRRGSSVVSPCSSGGPSARCRRACRRPRPA